jgi:hypothetical protein
MEALSEIKRYYPCDVRLKSGDAQVMFTEHLAGQLCIYEDIAPIVQRNRELEAELARLREQEPVAYWNGCILYTDPKPAQEIPAELVKWANNDEPNLEMDDSADVALEKIVRNECRAFVRSQLEKMKGKP